MSKIGKQLIPIPEGVSVKIAESSITVTGTLGELQRDLPDSLSFLYDQTEKTISVSMEKPGISARSIWGTYRKHISNMIEGVHKGFSKKLLLTGVGYRAQMKGKTLVMELGFSHPIEINPPADIKIETPDQTSIIISGINIQKVGQTAAMIRNKKKPEPYKGKGIAYEGETILRKAGKQAAGAGKK